MKVLLCVNSDIGRKQAIGFRFGKIAEALKKSGDDFEIIARANYSSFKVKTPFYKNYLGRFLNALRIYLGPFWDFRSLDIWFFDHFVLRTLKKFLSIREVGKLNFDLAHFGEYLPKSIRYLKERKIKILLDIPIGHHQYALYLKEKGFKLDEEIGPVPKYLNEAIELADVLIIPSEFVKKTLEMAGFESKPMAIVPFGVNLPNDTNRGNKSINNQVIKFIFAGNVNYRKGVNFLLEAWNKLDLKNAELLICGHIYKSIRKEIEKYQKPNIKFLGFVDLDKYFRQAHVFVFPTLLEGSAKAVYEAMSYGLPVITTFNAGSIVEDGKSGFIIPIGDSNALTEKMLYFYQNPDKIIEMGKNAFEKVRNYSWEKYAQKIVRIYTRCQYTNTYE